MDIVDLTIDDRAVRVATCGSGNRVLLALHGFGTDARSFARLSVAFNGSDYRLVIPDLAGFGESAAPEPDNGNAVSLHAYARFIHALSAQLQLKDVTVVGHSMGGKIALAAALDYPELYRAVVLINSGGFAYAESTE